MRRKNLRRRRLRPPTGQTQLQVKLLRLPQSQPQLQRHRQRHLQKVKKKVQRRPHSRKRLPRLWESRLWQRIRRKTFLRRKRFQKETGVKSPVRPDPKDVLHLQATTSQGKRRRRIVRGAQRVGAGGKGVATSVLGPHPGLLFPGTKELS